MSKKKQVQNKSVNKKKTNGDKKPNKKGEKIIKRYIKQCHIKQ
jgi:hypothetical protein